MGDAEFAALLLEADSIFVPVGFRNESVSLKTEDEENCEAGTWPGDVKPSLVSDGAPALGKIKSEKLENVDYLSPNPPLVPIVLDSDESSVDSDEEETLIGTTQRAKKSPGARKFGSCENPVCSRQASHGYSEASKPVRCVRHAVPGMVEVNADRVKTTTDSLEASEDSSAGSSSESDLESNILTPLSHNNEQPTTSSLLASSKSFPPPKRRCHVSHCRTWAAFGYSTERRRIACAQHKAEGMVHHRHFDRTLPVSETGEIPGRVDSEQKQFRVHSDSNPARRDSFKHSNSAAESKGPRNPWWYCQHPDCRKWPTCNFPDTPGRRYCREHRLPGMIDKTNKKFRRASRAESAGRRHSESSTGSDSSDSESGSDDADEIPIPRIDKVARTSKRRRDPSAYCQHANCQRWPAYNFPGEAGRRYCRDHKLDGMINKRLFKRDGKGACFESRGTDRLESITGNEADASDFESDGTDDNPIPRKRKRDDNVSTIRLPSSHCVEEGCRKYPSFDYPDEPGIRYCGSHAKEGMVNKKILSRQKRQMRDDSVDRVALDSEGSDSSTSSDAVPVRPVRRHVRCRAPGCTFWAYYGYQSDGIKRFCQEHAVWGTSRIAGNFELLDASDGSFAMDEDLKAVSTAMDEDLKAVSTASPIPNPIPPSFSNRRRSGKRPPSKTCQHPGCDKWPFWNFVDAPGRAYCSLHKKPDMIDKTTLAKAKREKKGQVAPTERSHSESTASSSDTEHEDDRPPRQIDLSRPAWATCRHPGCTKWPSWNFADVPGRRYCNAHWKPGMIDKTPWGARKRQREAQLGSTERKHSKRDSGTESTASHRESESAASSSGSNSESDSAPEPVATTKIAARGTENGSRTIAENRKLERAFTRRREPSSYCEHPGCEKWPHFNYPDHVGRRYCSKHQLPGMVNNGTDKRRTVDPAVAESESVGTPSEGEGPAAPPERKRPSQYCIEPGCQKSASFNFLEERGLRYCIKHAKKRMINKRNRSTGSRFPPLVESSYREPDSMAPGGTCAAFGCAGQGVFAFDDDLETVFCAAHAVMGMSLVGRFE